MLLEDQLLQAPPLGWAGRGEGSRGWGGLRTLEKQLLRMEQADCSG